MNILDKMKSVLAIPDVKLGFMPDTPPAMIGLFEYQSKPPEHHFGSVGQIYGLQVRVRDTTSSAAYKTANTINEKLKRYHDAEISVVQATPILDIGIDSANPPRHEYTINYTIRRIN